jgi:pre-rRNA-processing protein TSR1
MPPGNHHHRASSLRQQNKKNKRTNASKRSLTRAAGGKVNGPGTSRNHQSTLFVNSKADRLNRLQQKRDTKRAELLRKKRMGVDQQLPVPPRVIGIISLSGSEEIEGKLRSCLVEQGETLVSTGTGTNTNNTTLTAKYPVHKKDGALTILTNSTAFRQHYNDYEVADAAVQSALDLCRVCDMIVFVIDTESSTDDDGNDDKHLMEIRIGGEEEPSVNKSSANNNSQQGVNQWDHLISTRGDKILHAVKSQGLPSLLTVLAVSELNDADDMMSVKSVKSTRRANTKRSQSLRKYANRFALAEFGPDKDTVLEVDLAHLNNSERSVEETHQDDDDDQGNAHPNKKPDIAALIRALCQKAAAPSKWVLDGLRPFILSDSCHYDEATRELKISGFIRGKVPWSVNSLVHVPNLGTCACKRIERIEPPTSSAARGKNITDPALLAVVESDPSKRESLDMFATPDTLNGEQNLVGFDDGGDEEDEMAEGGTDNKARPTGWSDYQSAWLDAVDDMGADFDEGELAVELNKKNPSGTVAADTMDVDEANDVSATERQLLKDRRKSEHNENDEFPDEVEVGEDGKAMDRFARYRSLKSFRKTYWDPKENLPETYANVFHFSNFKATQRSVMQDAEDITSQADCMEMEDDSVLPSGSYVSITLDGVKAAFARKLPPEAMLVAVALLPHENKISVLHAGLSHLNGCDMDIEFPVKSKDVLTFRCGWRTWQTRPVFSQNNLNCNKHKFERFMPKHGSFFAATFFGPVTYTPCPVMVFRKQEGKPQELCAIGSMIGADADRIVVKRVLLTGYPVRVHKRHATVKYMFYNPDDVKWFRPAGLWTKHGLNGHIMESVGDHGTMKCLFNAPIKQHDTVCLPLYKRIFPKFASQSADGAQGSAGRERLVLVVK